MAGKKPTGLVKKIGHRGKAKEQMWKVLFHQLVSSWDVRQEVQRVPKKFPLNIKASLDCAALPWKFWVIVKQLNWKTLIIFIFIFIFALLVQKILPAYRVSKMLITP